MGRFLRLAKRRRVHHHHLWIIGTDLVIVLIAYLLVLTFRYEGVRDGWSAWTVSFEVFLAMAVIVHLSVNWLAGIYTIVNRYMSLVQAVKVAQAGILAMAVLFIAAVTWPLYAGGLEYLAPRSVVVAGGFLALIAMIGVRFSRRVMHEAFQKSDRAGERLLIVGAGQAADMLLREIQRTPSLNVQVAGLVDDSRFLANMSIQGYPILGRIADVERLVGGHAVTQIIVAIPSASAEELARIYRACKPAGVPVKILPSLADLVSCTVSLRDARDLDIKDLLGRPKIEIDLARISEFTEGQTILVTGAGGSIGSELCRQLARFDPGRLVLVDNDESSLYDLHERLQNQGFRRYVLCPTDILRERKLDKLFALHRPRLVFHAAAYKHVPLMELSPDEAVLNNVQGTLLVARSAARYRVERMVNISTDKAVDPVNVMGATKRAGELIVRMLSERHPETLFASVRFGNVLGSQGSVIPIFKSQIESGGPLVITHPDMTRYFMLIEEAVQLVIQAAVMIDEECSEPERSLDTFVLEMGDPVPIVELAQRMIDFYWQDQERSIGVEFSGLRPGEKLDERLVYQHEEAAATSHPLIKRVYTRAGGPSGNGSGDGQFERRVHELIRLAADHGDKRALIEGLAACVPGYTPFAKPVVEKPVALV